MMIFLKESEKGLSGAIARHGFFRLKIRLFRIPTVAQSAFVMLQAPSGVADQSLAHHFDDIIIRAAPTIFRECWVRIGAAKGCPQQAGGREETGTSGGRGGRGGQASRV
ncbi:hypothetical protein DNTS_022977 [Danionella cerebrum]|uniref:Uncharacterized protein n=1 Tax=Danionella cerebrum TaxID=2873325 RepID=A0A553RHG9_9TELE|nr:hypothetical protein DNTS_022977 [Danionella translucida]